MCVLNVPILIMRPDNDRLPGLHSNVTDTNSFVGPPFSIFDHFLHLHVYDTGILWLPAARWWLLLMGLSPLVYIKTRRTWPVYSSIDLGSNVCLNSRIAELVPGLPVCAGGSCQQWAILITHCLYENDRVHQHILIMLFRDLCVPTSPDYIIVQQWTPMLATPRVT